MTWQQVFKEKRKWDEENLAKRQAEEARAAAMPRPVFVEPPLFAPGSTLSPTGAIIPPSVPDRPVAPGVPQPTRRALVPPPVTETEREPFPQLRGAAGRLLADPASREKLFADMTTGPPKEDVPDLGDRPPVRPLTYTEFIAGGGTGLGGTLAALTGGISAPVPTPVPTPTPQYTRVSPQDIDRLGLERIKAQPIGVTPFGKKYTVPEEVQQAYAYLQLASRPTPTALPESNYEVTPKDIQEADAVIKNYYETIASGRDPQTEQDMADRFRTGQATYSDRAVVVGRAAGSDLLEALRPFGGIATTALDPWQKYLAEPAAAMAVMFAQGLIPGEQEIQARAAELRAGGMNRLDAALTAYNESDSIPGWGKMLIEIGADPLNLMIAPIGFGGGIARAAIGATRFAAGGTIVSAMVAKALGNAAKRGAARLIQQSDAAGVKTATVTPPLKELLEQEIAELEAVMRLSGQSPENLALWESQLERRKADLAKITAGGKVRLSTSMAGGGVLEGGLRPGSYISVHIDEIDKFRVDEYNRIHDTNYTAQAVESDAARESFRASNAEHYHASPVCKNLSAAKVGAACDANDFAISQAVARNIREVRPPTVTIENVAAYQGTPLYDEIISALDDAGYTHRTLIVDAADYGAAQSRQRLILQAVLEGDLPPIPPTVAASDWYALLRDLIEQDITAGKAKSVKEAFAKAPDEINRIRNMFKRPSGRLRLVPNEPIFTMGGSASKGIANARNAGGPAPTLKATPAEKPRIIIPGPSGLEDLSDAVVVEVTGRMMARLMGLPDDFILPSAGARGGQGPIKDILGNGIHAAITRNFVQPMIDIAVAGRKAGTVSGEAREVIEQEIKDLENLLNSPGFSTGQYSEWASQLAQKRGQVGSVSFIADIGNIKDYIRAIVTDDSPLARMMNKNPVLPVNPSAAASVAGRHLIAREQMLLAAGNSIDVALAAKLDSHAQRWTGRIGVAEGNLDINGYVRGTGKMWGDIYSNPDAYRSVISDKTYAYIKDVHALVREMNELLVRNGFDSLPLSKDGWFYVPRTVKGKGIVDFARPTNPLLERSWDEMTEGAERGGVRYETSPRATLELYLKGQMRRIVNKQFDEAISELGIAPTEAVPASVVQNRYQAERAYNSANRLVQRLKVARVPGGSAMSDSARKTAAQLRAQLKAQNIAAKEALAEARAARNAARKEYASELEKAKNAGALRGNIFGRAEEFIPVGTWRNRLFPREISDELLASQAAEIARTKGRREFELLAMGEKAVEVVGNYTRFFGAIADLGAPFFHGLPLLGRNPAAWAKATGRHYAALFDPTIAARRMVANIEDVKAMVAAGVPPGDVEFFAALKQGQGLEFGKALEYLGPKGTQVRRLLQQGGKQAFGRFQAAYNQFLFEARLEMWKSLRPGWGDDVRELAAYIRNMTGGLESRALGLGPSRRAIEGVWLAFSPKLLRSTVALMADAMRGVKDIITTGTTTRRQMESLRSIGQMTAGVTMVYIATGLALNKSWEEITAGLNPLEGKKFLSHQVNGDWIGVGGQIRSILQFTTRTISAIAPGGIPLENLKSSSPFENPIIAGYMGRGAPGVGVTTTVLEGIFPEKNLNTFREVDGLADIPRNLGYAALPFTLQGIVEGEQAPTAIAAFFGSRTSPATPMEKRRELRDQMVGVLQALVLADDPAFKAMLPTLKEAILRATTYEELPRDGQAIINGWPMVEDLNTQVRNRSLEYESGYENYRVDREKKAQERDARITEAYKRYGPGKSFREKVREITRDYGRETKQLREEKYKDAIDKAAKYFEEKQNKEPDTLAFDIALQKYYDVVSSDDLRDPLTGEFFFKEFERRIDALGFSPEMMLRIEQYNDLNDHVEVVRLRKARKLLKPYWEAWKRIPTANEDESRLWEAYNNLTDNRARVAFKNSNKAALAPLIRELDRIRLSMRNNDNPQIDVALVEYYEYKPKTAAGAEKNRQLLIAYPGERGE